MGDAAGVKASGSTVIDSTSILTVTGASTIVGDYALQVDNGSSAILKGPVANAGGDIAVRNGSKVTAHSAVQLAGTGVAVTRLARGLPSGSSLELANAQMLADALDGRRTF